MNTSELTGAWLDYWVATAEGVDRLLLEIRPVPRTDDFHCVRLPYEGKMAIAMNYHSSWALCGALVDKYCMNLEYHWVSNQHCADALDPKDGRIRGAWASSAREAICRAIVQLKFGAQVPDIEAIYRN